LTKISKRMFIFEQLLYGIEFVVGLVAAQK